MADEIIPPPHATDSASPYSPPRTEPLVVVAVVDDMPGQSPPLRIWPALVVGIVTMPVAFCVQMLAIIVITFIGFGLPTPDKLPEIRDWFTSFIYTEAGLAVLVLPGQVVFLASALLAARMSPQPFAERLALRTGRLPLWTWPVFALATPMIGFITSALLSQVIDDPGENMEMLHKLLRTQDASFVPVLLLLIGVLPGFSEEALFRGYVQSRLLGRLPTVAAIAISTGLFSLAHLDPKHVLAVIPLGAWLGILAWQSETIWPSIIGHMLNNSLAVLLTRSSSGDALAVDVDPLSLSVYGVCGAALVVAIFALIRYRSKSASVVSTSITPAAAVSGEANSPACSNDS